MPCMALDSLNSRIKVLLGGLDTHTHTHTHRYACTHTHTVHTQTHTYVQTHTMHTHTHKQRHTQVHTHTHTHTHTQAHTHRICMHTHSAARALQNALTCKTGASWQSRSCGIVSVQIMKDSCNVYKFWEELQRTRSNSMTPTKHKNCFNDTLFLGWWANSFPDKKNTDKSQNTCMLWLSLGIIEMFHSSSIPVQLSVGLLCDLRPGIADTPTFDIWGTNYMY